MTPWERRAMLACASALAGTALLWPTDESTSAAPRAAPTSGVQTSGAQTGAALFQAKGCAGCHSGPTSESRFGAGPMLRDATSWANDRRPGMTGRAFLTESIRNPSEFTAPGYVPSGGPMTGMPDLSLTDDEIDRVVDYLLGLEST